VTVTGWAGDVKARIPAREVIATVNGRVVGRAVPQEYRPDVPGAGYPTGFVGSGFQLSIPAAAAGSKRLRVLAVAQDRSVAALAVLGAPAKTGTVRLGHHTVRLEPSAVIGHVDSEAPAPPALQVKAPTGSTWTDYRWLEIDAPPSGFVRGSFEISDLAGSSDLGHVISFQTLTRSPHRYVIPVSSCAQWHGYRAQRLFLVARPSQHIAGVRLIR
jgi:hypothetical protein